METMMKELGKFGCQLPQFSKIGGILASELPVDEAALHAAVIAINEAVSRQVCYLQDWGVGSLPIFGGSESGVCEKNHSNFRLPTP